jgi:hypothetical protein
MLSLPFCFYSQAQVVLEANGPGSTYELINSVLAPGFTAVEAPDQCGNHGSFGRHIAEVWDATLNKFVFEFYSHVAEDNDRCISFDRQRVEIKSYDPSPANLKATLGETVTYKWFFRLPNGFQPSNNFTHIHQIKAVGGDDDDPLFTITPRLQGNGNTRMEIIYVSETSASNVYLATAPLSQFLGEWVEVTEQIFYGTGTSGRFSIVIKRVSDGATLINYSNNALQTFRTGNTFVRPKWGIYRSLNNSQQLRDDSLRLATISVFEGTTPSAPSNLQATAVSASQINLTWQDNSNNETGFVIERSLNGTSNWAPLFTTAPNVTSYANTGLSAGTTYYYRVSAQNPAGSSNTTSVANATTQTLVPVTLIAFNAIQKNTFTEISWKVVNEINLAAYELEGSFDGIRFFKITSIAAMQNDSYNFLHEQVIRQHYFYRLRMVDKDGSYQHSSIISVKQSINPTISIYPNPTSDYLIVEKSEFLSNAYLQIRGLDGKLLYNVPFNQYMQKISLSNCKNGTYFIQLLQHDKVIQSQKFMIKR